MPSGRQAVVLPQEVWQKITRHLTIREWASACGTCKAMFHLQLDSVNFGSDVCSKGIEWVSRRWSIARAMSCTKMRSSNMRVLANIVYNGGSVPGQVEDMIIHMDDMEQEEEGEENAPLVWLAWVFAQMHKLRYLDLGVRTFF
ncbi:hypothetical protein COCSUDRAFT_53879 [Coccomyxa subellipsoidea C-169]|uniref:F-box domain-containing protein n=1 Tax=Coccomyxa subellipsoidea (strain C-169) TaxID=574566 RepID=I0YU09_COCSC|nr:hypothetical protein COCSUDRAFT_53879 [Coccomyxa subellipsoidea C-169]EIE21878.1 hypothetical protein COCSUDRAFT_53879 [Coccomyxa subellipsoidea C-169]|eukprot:XP_005646422.1 hypothetical protein COCSUDRAFT_53879 [Coccomyxa subellipsoidea C-169]